MTAVSYTREINIYFFFLMNKSFHRTTNNYNTPVKTGTQSQQGLQQLPQATNNDRPKTPTNKTATTK
jgi:hypothetical protein